MTITPAERTSKVAEANNNRFYVAEFSFKRLSREAIATQVAVFKGMALWREDTVTADSQVFLSYNFNPAVVAGNLVNNSESVKALQSAA